jgi:TPR repeat protein
MSITHEQIIEVRARKADGEFKVGSGLLLPGKLVLTAAHVVFSEDGAPFDPVEVRTASERGFAVATVVWPVDRPVADAALLKIATDGWAPPGGLRSVRWGKITGSTPGVPCEAIGFPRVLRDENTGRDTDHMQGSINPGSQLRGAQYDIHVTSRVPEAVGKPWAGMSGAALFSGDLLIGVVVVQIPGYAGRSLRAEPIATFAADSNFAVRVTGQDHLELESAELTDMFGLPARRSERHSRTSLLDAAAEVVPFRGREDLVLRLWSWCKAGDDFAAQLIVGPGGQGKTRLARELCLRLRRDGWVAGLVHERTPAEVIRRLTDTSVPVLLAVDVAEARGDQIIALIEAAWRRPEPSPAIRLLMLARSEGDWWDQLRRKMPEPLRSVICEQLSGLEKVPQERADAYRDAMQAFAERLDEAEPGADWQLLASKLDQPDLAGAEFGSVLTLHMTALIALLQAGLGPTGRRDRRGPEDVLLDHEGRYWDESQSHYGGGIIRRCVAAATLCGASDEAEAVNLLAGLPTVSQWGRAERADLANLVHHLYPVPGGQFWGYLQPDRLGEHLIRRMTHDEPDFPDDAIASASPGQHEHAKAVFVRIGGRAFDEGDIPEAREWYRRAAVAGHNDAAYRLGELLQSDQPGQAQRWFEQAAASGHNDAAHALGDLLRGNAPAEARQWYERAATAGHTNAAFKLGQLLWEQGKPTEAKHWFMRAAAASHAEAAYELGWLLKNTEQDDLGTTYWWRTSAHLGWHGAGYHLAQDLEKQQKTAEARAWYEQAAPGHRDAAFRLAELLRDAGERAEARHWFERSARQGHAVAAFQLGCLMMEIQDFKEAGYWWHEADRLGYPGAKPLEIAEMLWARDWPAEAKAWFEEAARNGVHRAVYQLVNGFRILTPWGSGKVDPLGWSG